MEYKHSCGVALRTVAQSFVHLLVCPVELAQESPRVGPRPFTKPLDLPEWDLLKARDNRWR